MRESYEHDRKRRGVNLFKDKDILQRDEVETLCGASLPADVKTLVPYTLSLLGTCKKADSLQGYGMRSRVMFSNTVQKINRQHLTCRVEKY